MSNATLQFLLISTCFQATNCEMRANLLGAMLQVDKERAFSMSLDAAFNFIPHIIRTINHRTAHQASHVIVSYGNVVHKTIQGASHFDTPRILSLSPAALPMGHDGRQGAEHAGAGAACSPSSSPLPPSHALVKSRWKGASVSVATGLIPVSCFFIIHTIR